MAGDRTQLVDAHGHGVLPGDLGIGAFEARLPGSAAPHTTLFDSPTGFAVRRWCAPLLGLEPHCAPARYLARRRELGAYEATRLLLRATGIGTYLVDTGEPGDLSPPKELGAAGHAAAYETVRLEPLAQQVADTSGTADAFLANLAEAVHGAALSAAGFSCADTAGPRAPVGASPLGADRVPGVGRGEPGGLYPLGGDGAPGGGWGELGGPLPVAADRVPGAGPGESGGLFPAGADRVLGVGPPDAGLVRRAAADWLARRPVGERPTHPVLLRHLLWNAVATGLPLTLRHHPAGAGPPAAAGFLRATAGLGTDVVLLPGARQEGAAADLAAELPHVHVAVGADPAPVLARAPFGKVLWASRAAALPELYVTGARGFRAALGRFAEQRIAAGDWSPADARRVTTLITAANARRVYRLPPPGPTRGAHG